MIAEANAAYTPALIVMDGVEAFVDGDPEAGKRARGEVVLARTDRVALDAVGVALLRHLGTPPEVSQGAIFEQEQIARPVELGLGWLDQTRSSSSSPTPTARRMPPKSGKSCCVDSQI
jgi:uncharacterized protein (DUF362 family)